MKKFVKSLGALTLVAALAGCAYLPGGTDLSDVANDAGLDNVTTGDGTFENYTATGHYTATEIGLGFGIPGIGTLLPIFPAVSNEGLLGSAADTAKNDGADSMINVTPAQNEYYGIPFFIFGLYVDHAGGTGIDSKM